MSAAIGHPWVDERLAPLYVVQFPSVATDEQVDSYCTAVERWWATVASPVAFVVDATGVRSAGVRQRQRLAEHEKTNAPYTSRLMKGSALVVANPLIRGLVTAVFWLSPPNYEHTVTGNRAEAESWARARLGLRS